MVIHVEYGFGGELDWSVCVWGVTEALICSWVATFRWAISPFLLVSFESL